MPRADLYSRVLAVRNVNALHRKLIDDHNYFYRETAFLEVFLTFDASTTDTIDDEPESLD